jgi:hypothetical protein
LSTVGYSGSAGVVLAPAAGWALVRMGESAVADEEPDMRRAALPSWTSLLAGNMKRRSDQDPVEDMMIIGLVTNARSNSICRDGVLGLTQRGDGDSDNFEQRWIRKQFRAADSFLPKQ